MKADTLKYVNANGNGDIGPYNLQLNGTTNLQLFCLDDFRTVYAGETWTVNVVTGDSFYTNQKNSTNFKYEEEAYIYSMLGKSNGHGGTFDNEDVQDALWYVFDPQHYNSLSNDSKTLLSNASDFSYTKSFLDDYTFYIPTNWPERDGKPQDFEIKFTFGVAPLQQLIQLRPVRCQVRSVRLDIEHKQEHCRGQAQAGADNGPLSRCGKKHR